MSKGGNTNLQELAPTEAQALTGGDVGCLDTSEMLGLSGGDSMPQCISITCGYLGKIVVGIAEAFANVPAASYAYGKCGM